MALTDFKTHFDNSYQDTFPKVLVAQKIANTRYQSMLTYGQSVERVAFDISAVRVRDITALSDRTIDPVTDSKETLTIDKIKGTSFPISQYEKVQAGPLNPGSRIGIEVAKKLAAYVDADVFAETLQANHDFDNGDLTTLASTGVGITISSTTVPQMATRLSAKLRRRHVTAENLAFVTDSYAMGDIAQYMLGKSIDFSKSVYMNGQVNEPFGGAEVYVSENLTGEAVLTGTGTFSNGETVTIGGVVFTAVSTIGTNPGNFLIGANLAASLTNLAGLINSPATTSATHVALSTANQLVVTDALRLAATATATTVTVVGTGSGRIDVAETATNASWTRNVIHSYFGKKGAIDLVIQEEVDSEIREEPKQRTDNIFCDRMYGLKTFADGKVKFLDVLINA